MKAVSSVLRTSRVCNAAVARVGFSALLLQLVLTMRGVNVLTDSSGALTPVPTRIIRFFSYFTVQSNILCSVAAASLAVQPDRDGALWRVLRLAATVGITVTFVVYLVALRGLLTLAGLASLADTLLHLVMPAAVIVGWLVFGPRPRVDRNTVMLTALWPVIYLIYTLIHGAVSKWYPYPFIDVSSLGYAAVLVNGMLVAVLVVAVGGAYLLLDKSLPRPPG